MRVEDVEDIYKLTPVQQEILSRELASPAEVAHVKSCSYMIDGCLDAAAFGQAWQQVVERHPALRTSFHWENMEKPAQVVNRRAQLRLEMHDWRALSADEQQERAHDLTGAEQERSFDLTQSPLLRLHLMRTSDETHQLVWSYHALLIDEWSSRRILEEVFALYESVRDGREHRLEAAQPYKIYIEWLRRQDQTQAETFWRGLLDGASAPLPGRISSSTGSGGTQEEVIELSDETAAALRAQAEQHGLRLETLIEGVWGLLLSHYTDADDVVFGVAVSGRPATSSGMMSAVGLFGNVVPSRVRVSPDAALLPWLRKLQTRRDEIARHDYAAPSDIRRWAKAASGQTLFESVIGFHDGAGDNVPHAHASDLTVRRNGGAEKLDYPLVLDVALLPRRPSLRLRFERQSFHPMQARRMLAQFQTILEGIAADPARRLSTFLLLSPEQQRLLLKDWNGTHVGASAGACLHELFESAAERFAERTAVSYADESLTYGELNRRANQLARHLRRLGVGPEVPVGVLMPRSTETLMGLLGILKAGGVYVPLDPEYPQERLSYMLEDTRVAVLLTQQHLLFDLPPYAAASEIICLDSDWDAISCETDDNLPPSAVGANLAYVIYTSGSTGKPRGVCIPREVIAGHLGIVGGTFGLAESDRVLQFASLNFDVSVEQLLAPLLFGASVVLRDGQAWGTAEFYREVKRRGVTVVNIPPSFWNLLAQEGAAATELGLDRQVRLVIVGGDAVSPEAVRRWQQTGMRAARLLNAYGPTEATITATVYDVPPAADMRETSARVPIGHPLGDRRIYILDRHGMLSPIGAIGELHIGGALLARGYLNNPEQTAERFIPDAFGDEPGVRLYRTGDLARYREDGQIEFLGRVDHQIKIRGFRVEAGEIETALGQHPAVREAVVVAREEADGEKRLVAYVVSQRGNAVSVEDLRDALKNKLPAHMIPASFVLLDELPLTPNGKVDRQALPAPALADLDADTYVAPSTPLEQLLVGIWTEVLNVERVGVNDNFFDLGGHSLLATQVVSHLRQHLRADVSLNTFFEHPVIAELAREIEASGHATTPSEPPLLPVSRERDLPLSFAQQRLWFLDQLEPGSAAYNISGAMHFTGRLDTGALELTLGEIIRRHEVLRTTFDVRHGQPAQIINEAQPVSLPAVDLSELPESEGEARVRQLAIEDATTPVDLKRGPLLRFGLLRLSDTSHVLLVTMHHIISDGWSIGVFVREVATLYEAFSKGETSPLKELPLQYADYAVWQREWLQGAVLDEQLAYWRAHLADAPSVLELPTGRARPRLQSYRGAHLPVSLSPELTDQLKELSQREGVTLFMTLLAAFYVLLARSSGQSEVVVGTPIANRTHSETEALIGFFVNTLALRASLDAELSWQALLQRVREVCLGAYAHQEVPFEKLVEELQPERVLSHHPLFQVVLAWQNAPHQQLQLPGLTVRGLVAETTHTKFDLTLSLEERGGAVGGIIEYSTDLFDQQSIARMSLHFERLVAEMARDAQQLISRTPMLTEREREQVLYQWNQTGQAYPQHLCLHQLFEAQVEQTPDSIALIFEDSHLTYRQLNSRANQLAHYLQQRGVGPESLIGICMERSLEMVIALLGVLKAGGAYLPLDPQYPSQRLSFILDDARVHLLLTHHHLVDHLHDPSLELLSLDADWHTLASHSQEPPPCFSTAQNLAYVIYTSGSTGQPNGVLVTHANVARLFAATHEWFTFDEHDVWTLFHSYAFDFSVWELWGALLYGGRLVIVPQLVSRSPEVFYRLLVAEGVTVLNQTPSAFRQLMGAEESGRRGEGEMSLRLIIFGGEALETASLRGWFARHGDEHPQLVNMYGITETTVHVTYHPVTSGEVAEGGLSRIGRAIGDLELYLLDGEMEVVPVGVCGEMYVGGAGVARNYLNRAELTAERFVPHPYSGRGGERLYRSGDMGRYLADGEVEYVGRRDEQVKVRGFRIELGEVEAVLREHSGVKEAVAIVREDVPGDKRIVAYVVGAAAAAAGALGELRQYMKERLPVYMVPSTFVMLEKLPLTPNGKVDRRALPAPDQSRLHQESYEGPRSAVEEMLADIWRAVLGVAAIGIHENFFEVGGHSLLATQVISRVRQVFQVELPLRHLFEGPTVAELAERIEEEISAGGEHLLAPPIERVSRERPLPLSFAQQRLWFLDQLKSSGLSNNIPGALRLTGPLDAAALEQSLDEIYRRHESLRTTLVTVQGQPTQVIAEAARRGLPSVDLSGLPEAEREAEMRRRVEEDAGQAFDLSRGPLLRVGLIRLAPEEHVLFVTMHHVVSDGWSMGVFVRELGALYEAYLRGAASPLEELAVQYADYAVWQREWLQGEALERQIAYWKRQLEGAPPVLNLPIDHPRPAKQSFRGAVHSVSVPQKLTQDLKKLSRGEDTTLFMTLVAAFDVLLYHYTKQEDIVVGTDVTNRTRVETEKIIGFFVNQLVLRTKLSGAPTFKEILQRVREYTLGAYAHQDLPFDKLVEALNPERTLTHAPLFQVKFVLQNTPAPPLELAGLSLAEMPVENHVSRFDLTLLYWEEDGALRGCIEYDTELFEAATINRMAGLFAAVLQNVAARPDIALDELEEIVAGIERERKAEEARRRAESNFKRFKSIKPKAVSLPETRIVSPSHLRPGAQSPLVLQPDVAECDLADWAQANTTFIEGELLKHGALLFRGFKLRSAADFERFALTLCPQLFNENGEHPREAVSGNVYTPVFYPADKQLLWHNENSFNHQWPMKIWFCCHTPPQTGGETPLVDSRQVFASLSPRLRDRFIEKGVMYVRNYGASLGLSWQNVFQTESSAQVEERCRREAIDFEWKSGDRLKTRSVRPAVGTHPRTGESVWFNQAQHWHTSCLDAETRESLLSLFREEDLPRNCYYGDGSAIEDSVMGEILDTYRKLEVSFPWQKWDILMLDNMLSAHGRNPFTGERKLFVAMGEMSTYREVIQLGQSSLDLDSARAIRNASHFP